MLAWQGLYQLRPLLSTQNMNPNDEGDVVCVFQSTDGRNSILDAIMVRGGGLKSPVEWMCVIHTAITEEVDLLLKQVFRYMLNVCVWCVFVPPVLFLQLHRTI